METGETSSNTSNRELSAFIENFNEKERKPKVSNNNRKLSIFFTTILAVTKLMGWRLS